MAVRKMNFEVPSHLWSPNVMNLKHAHIFPIHPHSPVQHAGHECEDLHFPSSVLAFFRPRFPTAAPLLLSETLGPDHQSTQHSWLCLVTLRFLQLSQAPSMCQRCHGAYSHIFQYLNRSENSQLYLTATYDFQVMTSTRRYKTCFGIEGRSRDHNRSDNEQVILQKVMHWLSVRIG